MRHYLIEAVGWLSLLLNIWGNMALVHKKTYGWPVRLATNLAWIVYSIGSYTWPFLTNHIAFTVINARGWWKWYVEEKRLRDTHRNGH